MSAPRPTSPRPAPRNLRLVVLWTAVGVLLGVLLAVSLPHWRERPSGFASLQLVVITDTDGPGVSYALDFESEREGYPVVVHVDASGFPSLLVPSERGARVPAGQRLRLPDPQGTTTWWTPGDAEITVLAVLAEDPVQDVDRLVELVERAATRAPDAPAALRDVQKVLRRRLGEPVVRTLRPAEPS